MTLATKVQAIADTQAALAQQLTDLQTAVAALGRAELDPALVTTINTTAADVVIIKNEVSTS
jgi:hypothetical protein